MRSLTFPTKAGEPTILVQTVGSLQQLSCLPRMPSMAISSSQVKFRLYFFMQQNVLLYIMYIKGGVPKSYLDDFEGYLGHLLEATYT